MTKINKAVVSGLAITIMLGTMVMFARPADNFVAGSHTYGGTTLPYRFLTPYDHSPSEKYPLVLGLHGGGGKGTDNWKQITYHTVSEVWAESLKQAEHPCFVVAPQIPDGGWSSRNTWVMSLLDKLLADHPTIDPDRIYTVGVSLGGAGVWDLSGSNPTRFAALMPMAAPTGATTALKSKHIPVWITHGQDDDVVSVNNARSVANAFKSSGIEVIYTHCVGEGLQNCVGHYLTSAQLDSVVALSTSRCIYSEPYTGGHTPYTIVFALPQFFDWVFSQSKAGFIDPTAINAPRELPDPPGPSFHFSNPLALPELLRILEYSSYSVCDLTGKKTNLNQQRAGGICFITIKGKAPVKVLVK